VSPHSEQQCASLTGAQQDDNDATPEESGNSEGQKGSDYPRSPTLNGGGWR